MKNFFSKIPDKFTKFIENSELFLVIDFFRIKLNFEKIDKKFDSNVIFDEINKNVYKTYLYENENNQKRLVTFLNFEKYKNYNGWQGFVLRNFNRVINLKQFVHNSVCIQKYVVNIFNEFDNTIIIFNEKNLIDKGFDCENSIFTLGHEYCHFLLGDHTNYYKEIHEEIYCDIFGVFKLVQSFKKSEIDKILNFVNFKINQRYFHWFLHMRSETIVKYDTMNILENINLKFLEHNFDKIHSLNDNELMHYVFDFFGYYFNENPALQCFFDDSFKFDKAYHNLIHDPKNDEELIRNNFYVLQYSIVNHLKKNPSCEKISDFIKKHNFMISFFETKDLYKIRKYNSNDFFKNTKNQYWFEKNKIIFSNSNDKHVFDIEWKIL